MKITVGHLMIVAGVGAYVVMGPLGGFHRLDKSGAKEKASADVVTPVVRENLLPESNQVPPVSAFEEKLPAAESLPVAPVDEPKVDAPVEEPKVAAPAAEEAPVARPARRKRKRPASQAAAPKKVSGSDLTGVYVTLKLANGREVKGALVEQSASFYKIELPGLGAMSYPVRDVVSIAPAQ